MIDVIKREWNNHFVRFIITLSLLMIPIVVGAWLITSPVLFDIPQ